MHTSSALIVTEPSPESSLRTNVFVAAVTITAVLIAFAIWKIEPVLPAGAVKAMFILGLLALLGEAWQFVLPKSGSSSIAFIAYAAMGLVTPTWAALAAVVCAKLLDLSFTRRPLVKALFNVGQFVIMWGCSILVYRWMGGQPFLQPNGALQITFAATTSTNGFAAFAGFCVAFGVNMVLASTVIAFHTGRTIKEVWRENHLPGVALDLLAAPVVFLFAWVYANWGPIAAALLWVPILGYRHTLKTTIDLEQTNRELLELMIKSIEARDPYTSGHSRRVQQYAMLIARAIHLSEKEVEQVGTAALLHDVGKIHEKYGRILTKEDKLTPEEWALMREHPIDGADLVATMTRLHEFVQPVRHHHENWDGTGYPDGLAGERIPLASRVIMFADTIDAMTTARPYRGPLSEEIVRAEIVRRRGEQFDPSIADAILSSPTWKQLFVPAHPAARGFEMTLAASTTGEFVLASKQIARNLVRRAAQ